MDKRKRHWVQSASYHNCISYWLNNKTTIILSTLKIIHFIRYKDESHKFSLTFIHITFLFLILFFLNTISKKFLQIYSYFIFYGLSLIFKRAYEIILWNVFYKMKKIILSKFCSKKALCFVTINRKCYTFHLNNLEFVLYDKT